MQRDEALAAITLLVAECLALKPDTIAPESRLVNDLGASSLDFIDLAFSLERRFGVRIQEEEFEFVAKIDASTPEAAAAGRLAPETIDRLKRWIPALSAVEDPSKVTAGELFKMVTVETLWLLVQTKLEK